MLYRYYPTDLPRGTRSSASVVVANPPGPSVSNSPSPRFHWSRPIFQAVRCGAHVAGGGPPTTQKVLLIERDGGTGPPASLN